MLIKALHHFLVRFQGCVVAQRAACRDRSECGLGGGGHGEERRQLRPHQSRRDDSSQNDVFKDIFTAMSKFFVEISRRTLIFNTLADRITYFVGVKVFAIFSNTNRESLTGSESG